MNFSAAFKRTLIAIAAAGAVFLLIRGVWLGAEGLTGHARLDQRDWISVLVCLLAGLRLMIFVQRGLRKNR